MSPCQGEEGGGIPPFRRLLLSPERLPKELKRVEAGVLVRLPVAEFDALVQRAAQATKPSGQPQLVEARYHATLKDESLVGEGQWKIVHSGQGPGLLNLQPFNLALRQARFENGEAIIAAFDGNSPALLVERPGEQSVALDWSARAESSPGGLQFHLEMPPCPVALLELDVPAGRLVTVLNDSAFLSGPHEAENPDLRRWKIVCGGRQRVDRQRVDLRIQSAEKPGSSADAAAPFVHQKTTQKLYPQGLDATFELTLDGSHSGIRELVCECDAELRLRDVVGPGVESCWFQAGAGNKPSRLMIRLREPVLAGTWKISCLAPLERGGAVAPESNQLPDNPPSAAWRSPGLRLVNGVPCGEALTLWLHPDLRVESWDPGSYRLSSSDQDRATGSQVLTLSGGGLAPPRRPTARLQAFAVEFSTQQFTWFRCNGSGMSLNLQIGWDVTRGQLFQLPVLLPVGWEVEKVELTPAALLRDWYVRRTAEEATLFVDLATSLGAPVGGKPDIRTPKFELGSMVSQLGFRFSDLPRRLPALTVQLRPTRPSHLTPTRLKFPDAVPLGARFRDGALAVSCDEQLYQIHVQSNAERTEPLSEGPWGQQSPEYYYRYRGQPMTGEILIRPRPPRVRAKCESEVLAAGSEAVIESHLSLEADAGSPNTIELSLSAGDGEAWPWRTEVQRGEEATANRVRHTERLFQNETSFALHLLAATHPLQTTVLEAARPISERWRLTLARPLRLRETLRLYARRRLQLHDNRWEVPLPVVVGAESMEAEVVLHQVGGDPMLVQSVGLSESPTTTEQAAPSGRAFRYGQKDVRLVLSSQTRESGRSGGAPIAPVGGLIERARLITSIEDNGDLRQHFSFSLAHWSGHTFPLRLPPGSKPSVVQVDGCWLPHLVSSSLDQQGGNEKTGLVELALPVPRRDDGAVGNDTHSFEIVYWRQGAGGTLWQVVDAPVPHLPIAPIALRRIWRLHPKLTPLRQERYRSAPGRLRTENTAGASGTSSRTLDYDYQVGDWTMWEPIAGDGEDRLIVVRRDAVTILGLALGLLLGLLFLLLRRRAVRFGMAGLLVALAFSGLGVLWLPASLRDLAWWPLLATVAHAVWAHMSALLGKPATPQSSPPKLRNAASLAAVGGILTLSILGWNGRAAAPAPATVYLVPASADAPDKQTVLVPADLLDRLKALDHPAPIAPGGPGSLLLDALYEGQIVDNGKEAEFSAVYSSLSLTDQASTLIVPLDGVRLVGEVLLDGARVAPLAAPQEGYALPLSGRGRHRIELHFRVPVAGTREDRNVLFNVPALLRSRLSWRVPDGAVEPQVLVKNGAQWVSHEGGLHLLADLGSLPLPVHLHWYQPSRPTRVSYQGAYLWDLGLEASTLTAYLRYHVEQGSIKTLEVDLPAELEVNSANAQRTPTSSQPWSRTRCQLRDWHIRRSADKRVLHLEFPYPISGDFQVTLELSPRTPLSSRTALPLPWPRGIGATGPHYLAYRTQPGLNAQRDTSQNLTRIPSKEFASDWRGGPSLEASFQGVAFRIPPNRPPQLLLRLEPRPPDVETVVDLTVRVGSQRAELEVVADITAPNKDLAVIEWELPPHCLLVAASGDAVRSWKQNGSALLVWLDRTTAKTRIHLSGWLRLTFRDGHSPLQLNGPHLRSANKQLTRLHLAVSDELALAGVRTRNLKPTTSEIRNPKSEIRKEIISDFETRESSFNFDCQVQSAVKVSARVLIRTDMVDRELRFRATVDYNVAHGELRQVRLRLRNWDGEKVEVQAERVALRSGPRRVAGERSWQLPLQAGIRGRYQVVLSGSMPLEKAAGGVLIPEVLVQGVERAEYFVAVAGGVLNSQATGSLQPLKPESRDQKADPVITDLLHRGDKVWHVSGSEWQVRLLPQLPLQQSSPVHVYLLEHRAELADGRRWQHEVRFWLRQEAHANLTLDFAAPIRLLSVSVDDVEARPRSEFCHPQFTSGKRGSISGFRLSDSNNKVWLSLPVQSGVHEVRLRWLYDGPEPWDHPNVETPQPAGAVLGPTLWTVMVPAGWDASLAGAEGWQGAARDAELALGRAAAQLRICQDLSKAPRDSVPSASLAAAQQRFNQYCQQVRRALESDGGIGGMTGSHGQKLADWFEDLQTKNRLLRPELRDRKSESASGKTDFGPGPSDWETMEGLPLSWLALPDGQPFTIHLVSRESQRIRHAMIASGEWIAVLAVMAVLSLVPFFRTRLHLFWPEQVALVGVIGWHMAGWTAIGTGLLIVAGGGRAFLMIRTLHSSILKHRQQPSAAPANSPSSG